MSKSVEFRFDLGDKVKERITGQTGIVTTRSECLFGCNRYWLTPQELKDGKPVDGSWADEDALELVEAGVIKAKRYRVYEEDDSAEPVRRAGGPTDQPRATTGPVSR